MRRSTRRGEADTSTSTQWQLASSAAQRYEQIIVPSFIGPFARITVERAQLQSGESVLDAGCGTGIAARYAAAQVGERGTVIGIDINAGMIQLARSLPPTAGAPIDWREESIYKVSSADASLDAVLCTQVLQFIVDKPKALGEIKRVLKDGGRVAISVWPYNQSPYADALLEAVKTHLGAEPAAGLKAGYALGDAEVLRALLEAAGFGRIKLTLEEITLNFPRMEEFVPRHLSATPLAASFGAADAVTREALVHQVAERLAAFEDDKEMHLPFRSHVAIAWK